LERVQQRQEPEQALQPELALLLLVLLFCRKRQGQVREVQRPGGFFSFCVPYNVNR
jgi:hypothetical protein